MEPLLVEVTRGDVVEAQHRVHVVAVRDGRLELQLGDPELVTFLRSSSKPIQALPVLRARPDLDDEEIVLLCASHLGQPEQVAIVERILATAEATEDDLECGPAPTRIRHNCSGKHAGFILLCRAEGWPVAGYHQREHPCQQAMLAEVAAAADVDPASIPIGVDGCGVPTFAFRLDRIAGLFGRFPTLPAADRAIAAMHTRPELLRGPVAADVAINRSLEGWVAKGGAEGLLCASGPTGLGLVLKVEDGAFRAIRPALGEALRRLGIDPGDVDLETVVNSRGETVGAARVA